MTTTFFPSIGSLEGTYGFTDTSSSMASGQVSDALGLNGPALSFDTACSSGLLAVHMACRSLDGRERDLALAGGVKVMGEPRRTLGVGRACSRRPDAAGRSTWRPTASCAAEGCVVVLLKRLPDA